MSNIEALQNSTPTDWSVHDQQLANSSDWNVNRYAMDNKLHVQFYMKPAIDQVASAAANRPIYKDTEFVRIMLPGDKQNIIDRQVGVVEDERRRFAQHYAKFKTGQAEQIVGTPLTLVPFLTPAQAEEYKFFNIRTVEQLAAAPDSIGGKFMGFNQHKQKAQAFLDASTGAEAVKELRDKTEAQARMIEQMTKQLQELSRSAAPPPSPPARGR
jgi:hypothetical protein